uniref:Uncharacterized protein n=1 Tax=Molossus molossus TaxID=27622 RepID=A0A7J8CSA9_MOLMO|nr:hypothetical protein HJG59_009819 [Molossus molossus]
MMDVCVSAGPARRNIWEREASGGSVRVAESEGRRDTRLADNGQEQSSRKEQTPGTGIAGSHGSSLSISEASPDRFLWGPHRFAVRPAMQQGSLSSTASPTLGIFSPFLIMASLTGFRRSDTQSRVQRAEITVWAGPCSLRKLQQGICFLAFFASRVAFLGSGLPLPSSKPASQHRQESFFSPTSHSPLRKAL